MSGNDRRNSGRDESTGRVPSSEEIAERAYARYEARRQSGHEDRSPEDDWYEAERELREAADTPPIDPEETTIYAAPPHAPRSELPSGRGDEGRERSASGDDRSAPGASREKRPRKVDSFSPRPESAEKTHAEPPEPESMPPSFSPRPESAKTTHAPRKKPPERKSGAGRAGKRAPTTKK